MTHILVNPGYSNFRRSKTVDADLVFRREEKRLLSPREFDKIRSASRIAWRSHWQDPGEPRHVVGEFTTTYSTGYHHKMLDRPTKCRPTSPTRRNNPHPTKVFLHLHVLKDNGYPAPRPMTGQNPYEGSLPSIVFAANGKYYNDHYENVTPAPPGTMYYTLKEIKDLQRTGRTETLRKINMSPDGGMTWHHDLVNNSSNVDYQRPASKPDKIVPSLHRWLKEAGKEEKEAITNVMKSWKDNSKRKLHLNNVDPDRYVLRRYETTPRVTIHRPHKTDFVIHPEFYET